MKTNYAKVVSVSDEIKFDNGTSLFSNHESECCEYHWLELEGLTLADFDRLEFDLEGDFFDRVEGYGIALKPVSGHPVRIPGYGSNNGYYSSELTLILKNKDGVMKEFDISECQEIKD